MKKILNGLMAILVAITMVPSMVSAEETATYTSKYWDDVVTAMTSEEFKNSFGSHMTVSVTSDANNLEYKFTNNNTSKTYTIKYTQQYGIVYFTTANTNNDGEFAFIESLIHAKFIKTVATIYGYDYNAFMSWLDSTDSTKLDVQTAGIAYENYSATYSMTSETGSVNISVETFKTLKLNVDCGISAYIPPVVTPDPEPTPEPTPEPEEEVVENPDTSLYLSLGLVGVALAGATGYVVSKKKTYFAKI